MRQRKEPSVAEIRQRLAEARARAAQLHKEAAELELALVLLAAQIEQVVARGNQLP